MNSFPSKRLLYVSERERERGVLWKVVARLFASENGHKVTIVILVVWVENERRFSTALRATRGNGASIHGTRALLKEISLFLPKMII